ncbi:MAG: Gfo/Idh/MocA family protein [Armatimonadota bacterium]
MKTLNTAVVGLGRIGFLEHIPYINEHEGFELVAVMDPLPERLEEAFAKYGVPGYTDLNELLDNEEALDLVVLASPTHLHADQAIAVMERGVDVFCDKPIAPDVVEADRMIEAMRRTGRKLMVFQPHRGTPEAAAARHIIDSDLLGPIYEIKRSWSSYVRRNDWQALKKYGGGMLNNYGAHLIDQLLYLTQSKATKIACHMRSIASLGDADDVVSALIEMESGVICTLEINMAAAQGLPPWYIMGKRGTATFDPEKQVFNLKYYVESELSELQLNTNLASAGRRYDNLDRIPWHEAEVAVADFKKLDFYDKVYDYFGKGEKPFVPIQETREVMRVIWECRRYSGWE